MTAPLNGCIGPGQTGVLACTNVSKTDDPDELQYVWGGARGDKSVFSSWLSALDQAAGLDFVANSSHGLSDETARSFARRLVSKKSKR